MDTFLLFGLVGFACCILGVLGYTATTNKIIKEQEREIGPYNRKQEAQDSS